jgi:hypothetical protein
VPNTTRTDCKCIVPAVTTRYSTTVPWGYMCTALGPVPHCTAEGATSRRHVHCVQDACASPACGTQAGVSREQHHQDSQPLLALAQEQKAKDQVRTVLRLQGHCRRSTSVETHRRACLLLGHVAKRAQHCQESCPLPSPGRRDCSAVHTSCTQTHACGQRPLASHGVGGGSEAATTGSCMHSTRPGPMHADTTPPRVRTGPGLAKTQPARLPAEPACLP